MNQLNRALLSAFFNDSGNGGGGIQYHNHVVTFSRQYEWPKFKHSGIQSRRTCNYLCVIPCPYWFVNIADTDIKAEN